MEMIRCPVCRSFFRNEDHVAIDVINTIIHMKCLEKRQEKFFLEVKEYGKYKDLKRFNLAEEDRFRRIKEPVLKDDMKKIMLQINDRKQ